MPRSHRPLPSYDDTDDSNINEWGPGWYPDPMGSDRVRWYNGHYWTHRLASPYRPHVSPALIRLKWIILGTFAALMLTTLVGAIIAARQIHDAQHDVDCGIAELAGQYAPDC